MPKQSHQKLPCRMFLFPPLLPPGKPTALMPSVSGMLKVVSIPRTLSPPNASEATGLSSSMEADAVGGRIGRGSGNGGGASTCKGRRFFHKCQCVCYKHFSTLPHGPGNAPVTSLAHAPARVQQLLRPGRQRGQGIAASARSSRYKRFMWACLTQLNTTRRSTLNPSAAESQHAAESFQ